MSGLGQFMNKKLKEQSDSMNTCLVCRIVNYDPSIMKADVKPMNKFNGNELSMLINVPVSILKAGPFIIRPPYKEGDLVLVVFSQRSIDEIIATGQDSDAEDTRSFSENDAIVVSGLNTFNSPLPAGHENDLIIGKSDFTAKIVIKENGDMEFVTTGNMLFNAARYDFVE